VITTFDLVPRVAPDAIVALAKGFDNRKALVNNLPAELDVLANRPLH